MLVYVALKMFPFFPVCTQWMDIKNNRLELLKMFCNTFNIFVNFSKLEGLR